jgi:UDP-3-O-[3-hydroxymyristoyl] glucosamine N-acyltransferase
MADPRFFPQAGPFTLARLAEIAQAQIGRGEAGKAFRGVATLETAGPDDVSFLDNRRYIDAFIGSRAGACLVRQEFVDRAPAGMALLLTERPYHGYAGVARAFHPDPEVAAAIDPRASVDPTARVGAGTAVAAGAVIGPRAEIGARCRIGANAVIGSGVVVGDDTVVGANASLSHCLVGARVLIYPGVRIGQDGFGFAIDPKGHVKVPQLGRVVIGDDVEIGANSCIDRGAVGDTVIGPGCMIDNLVQIGHNVQLGRGCVIVSLVGISGSTRLGDFVVVGGQSGFAGHLRIGSGVRVAAQSGVHKDVPDGVAVGGSPAVPVSEWRREIATIKRLAKRKDE